MRCVIKGELGENGEICQIWKGFKRTEKVRGKDRGGSLLSRKTGRQVGKGKKSLN